MSKTVVLLVEGRRANGCSVEQTLKEYPCRLRVASNGHEAIKIASQQVPHLVIFNAATMRSNGVRSCQRLRRAINKVPMIYIRPSNQPPDITADADIYLQQPFTPRKLKNRIKALLPANQATEEIVRCGDITYYRKKRSVAVRGKGESSLTPKLALLLEEFLLHYNQVVSRTQLMQNVWKTDYIGDTRTLDVHIRWVRELIERDPANPRYLKTVRGHGYVLAMPARV